MSSTKIALIEAHCTIRMVFECILVRSGCSIVLSTENYKEFCIMLSEGLIEVDVCLMNRATSFVSVRSIRMLTRRVKLGAYDPIIQSRYEVLPPGLFDAYLEQTVDLKSWVNTIKSIGKACARL